MQAKPSQDQSHLQDMLTSARQAVSYVRGQTFEQFWDDAKTRDAVAMRITVIGEAAGKVSQETAAKAPKIPFHQISGLRNRIAHNYESVDFREVWKITQQDLKSLISELEKYIQQLKPAQTLAQKIPQAMHLKIDPPNPRQGPRMGM